MPNSYCRAYYHFVWSTWNRESWIEGEIERHIYASIHKLCKDMKCEIVALSGTADHVHLLVSLPPTLCISTFIQKIKGCSSRFLNEAHETPTMTYKWQGSYGVLTICPDHTEVVSRYVKNQKEHHRDRKLWAAAERTQTDRP